MSPDFFFYGLNCAYIFYLPRIPSDPSVKDGRYSMVWDARSGLRLHQQKHAHETTWNQTIRQESVSSRCDWRRAAAGVPSDRLGTFECLQQAPDLPLDYPETSLALFALLIDSQPRKPSQWEEKPDWFGLFVSSWLSVASEVQLERFKWAPVS